MLPKTDVSTSSCFSNWLWLFAGEGQAPTSWHGSNYLKSLEGTWLVQVLGVGRGWASLTSQAVWSLSLWPKVFLMSQARTAASSTVLCRWVVNIENVQVWDFTYSECEIFCVMLMQVKVANTHRSYKKWWELVKKIMVLYWLLWYHEELLASLKPTAHIVNVLYSKWFNMLHYGRLNLCKLKNCFF